MESLTKKSVLIIPTQPIKIKLVVNANNGKLWHIFLKLDETTAVVEKNKS
jgi:hypothetical protein